MMAQARLRKASWMSSRISQRMRSRREPVQQCDGLLNHPAVHAQPGAMLRATAGDHGSDALLPDLLTVFVVVIAAVSVDLTGPLARAAAAAAHRRDGPDQGHELGDVVAVPAGQRHRQRDPVRFADHVVLRARPGTIDRARSVLGRPSSPAHGSCQSPPWTSPAPRQHSAQPAAPRAAAARPRPDASPAAAASRSSRTRSPAPAAGTPTGCPCTGRTRCRTAPCGHPAACGQDDQPGGEQQVTTARS